MSIIKKKSKQFLPLLFISMVASSSAFARDYLDAISVIATKTERTIFNTPDTVSKVGIEEIGRIQPQKLSDVLKNVPGVAFSAGPRAIAEKPLIRGLGGNRILITVDGARQNFNSTHKGRIFIDTDVLKEVEILRGPGSAVYGSGAIGGVIALKTKDAEDYLEPSENIGIRFKTAYQGVNAEKKGTATLFARSDFMGGIDILFNGSHSTSSDIKLGKGDDLENSAGDLWSHLSKVKWSIADSQDMTVSHQYSFQSGEVPAQADLRTSATAVLTDRETEVTLDRIEYSHQAKDNTWLNLTAFVYLNQQNIREKRIGTNGRLDTIDFDTMGIDIRNVSDLVQGNITHRLNYGLEYYEDTMESREGAKDFDSTFPEATSNVMGVYLQDEIAISFSGTSSLLLIPGLRFDKAESESDQAEAIGVQGTTIEEQLSPKLGIIYKKNKNTNFSFNYSQAFRIPNFQELYISGVHFGTNNFVPNSDLESEQLEHGYELGVRTKLPGIFSERDKTQFRASIYWNEYTNFIDSIVTATITTFDNIGQARVYGAELEASHYSADFDMDTSLSMTYAKGDNQVNDQPLSSIPGHSIKLNIQKYLPDLGMTIGARGAFNLTQDRVSAGQPETGSYNIYDLYLTWTPAVESLKDLQFVFGVDNVADKLYTPHLSSLPAAGRNIKLSVSLQI
jgi:hemoglobin/transferrin/lactoferrin receptor protein